MFALIAQLALAVKASPQLGLSYPQGIIRYFSFMTIWSNILVALCFIVPLIAGKSKLNLFISRPVVLNGILVYIFVVAFVYHFFLADAWNPAGLQLSVDILLHYIMPFLYIVYWFTFTEKAVQPYINSVKWLVYPLVYVIYVLVRGAVSSLYPYPFLDVIHFGYADILKNIFILAVTYFSLGVILIFMNNSLVHEKSPEK